MAIQYIVVGDLDARGMTLRQSDWNKLAVAGQDVQLNLQNVKKIDPSGLGAIIFLFKRLTAARRKFEIINASGQPAEYLSKFNVEAILGTKAPRPARRQAMPIPPRGPARPQIRAGGRA